MERFFELPWVLQAVAWVTILGFYFTPVFILRTLERIQGQNERIISLLVDIKRGDRNF